MTMPENPEQVCGESCFQLANAHDRHPDGHWLSEQTRSAPRAVWRMALELGPPSMVFCRLRASERSADSRDETLARMGEQIQPAHHRNSNWQVRRPLVEKMHRL